MTTSTIKVFLVDDHPVVREGLSRMLQTQKDMIVVGEATDGEMAVQQYKKLRPDVTLMDIRMPGLLNGIETIGAIRKDFLHARIIVFSTYDRIEDVYKALKAGALGYLLKDTPAQEILDAIRIVHAGRRYVPPEIAAQLSERISVSELTPREMEVLELIAAGNSNKEIGVTLGIAEGTIKAHVNNILTKLGVSDRTQAVGVAIKRGLVNLD